MKEKGKVYHFHNGSGGGVLTVIENLVKFSDSTKFEHHIIYTINKDNKGKVFTPDIDGVTSTQIFYYSPRWNFYHTCKRLSLLLPDPTAVLLANDWLELAMVSQTAITNPVIQILHGDYDYYYNLAEKHQSAIHFFVTVAAAMADHLRKVLPARSKEIFYAPFPVPSINARSRSNANHPLQIIFVGRLSREKGYDLLPQIEKELRQRELRVKWHIVGEVTTREKTLWNEQAEIQFYGSLPNQQVIELMRSMDCLILPSLAEGMPVTLVEAMKAGLTCLVNDIPGGIQELITNGVTGFKISGNRVESYTDIIRELNAGASLMARIGEAAREKACEAFDPISNTARYEYLFEKCSQAGKTARAPIQLYGSRLDQPWIPNFITTLIRSLFRTSSQSI